MIYACQMVARQSTIKRIFIYDWQLRTCTYWCYAVTRFLRSGGILSHYLFPAKDCGRIEQVRWHSIEFFLDIFRVSLGHAAVLEIQVTIATQGKRDSSRTTLDVATHACGRYRCAGEESPIETSLCQLRPGSSLQVISVVTMETEESDMPMDTRGHVQHSMMDTPQFLSCDPPDHHTTDQPTLLRGKLPNRRITRGARVITMATDSARHPAMLVRKRSKSDGCCLPDMETCEHSRGSELNEAVTSSLDSHQANTPTGNMRDSFTYCGSMQKRDNKAMGFRKLSTLSSASRDSFQPYHTTSLDEINVKTECQALLATPPIVCDQPKANHHVVSATISQSLPGTHPFGYRSAPFPHQLPMSAEEYRLKCMYATENQLTDKDLYNNYTLPSKSRSTARPHLCPMCGRGKSLPPRSSSAEERYQPDPVQSLAPGANTPSELRQPSTAEGVYFEFDLCDIPLSPRRHVQCTASSPEPSHHHTKSTARKGSEDLAQQTERLTDVRQELVSEFIAEEMKYTKELGRCISGYLLPLRQQDTADVGTLFGNIERLHAVTESLIRSLTLSVSDNGPRDANIGGCFTESIGDLASAYLLYCSAYDASADLMAKCYSNGRFQRELAMCRGGSGGGGGSGGSGGGGGSGGSGTASLADLRHLLLRPTQHMLTYAQRLRQLRKYTGDVHPDQQLLREAVMFWEDLTLMVTNTNRRRDCGIDDAREAHKTSSGRPRYASLQLSARSGWPAEDARTMQVLGAQPLSYYGWDIQDNLDKPMSELSEYLHTPPAVVSKQVSDNVAGSMECGAPQLSCPLEDLIEVFTTPESQLMEDSSPREASQPQAHVSQADGLADSNPVEGLHLATK